MLIVEKTTLVLSAPGSLGCQGHFWVTQMKGVDNVSYFSRVHILCFQQRKIVEGKISTMWSTVVRIFYDSYRGVSIAFGRKLADIHVPGLVS